MEHTRWTIEHPPNLRLLPGEELLSVVDYPPRAFEHERAPSSYQQILRLTHAAKSKDIGDFGPSIAALSLQAEKEAPDHLRLYEVVFGRDSLRVATDLLPIYPKLARSTLHLLAELQGVGDNISREEEPGRIIHEARSASDPIALELTDKLGWGWPYYGSVDATPKFIRLMADYCKLTPETHQFLNEPYTAKDSEPRVMADALTSAVGWITRRLDNNPEGLLEFKSALTHGIENQVWKDSWDSYHHEDGTLANHKQGVASIEVQAATYNALLDAAQLYEDHLGRSDQAADLRERARRLKHAILDIFWCEEKGGYFVLGTDRDDDGNLRQLKVRTSNMGHVLNSRLLEGDDPEIVRRRNRIAKQLSTPEMLNMGGIRTLASDEIRYRPGAYHNGSVWLWDTHYIAKGLRRHGYVAQADDLDNRIMDVVNTTKMFPEYIRGDSDIVPLLNSRTVVVMDTVNGRKNQLEQPPQEIQAWTVAAILALKYRRNQDARARLANRYVA